MPVVHIEDNIKQLTIQMNEMREELLRLKVYFEHLRVSRRVV